jgi:hypothetical protein
MLLERDFMNRIGDFCLPNGDKIFVCTDDKNEETYLLDINDRIITLDKIIENFPKGEIFYKFLMDDNLVLVINRYRMMVDLVCKYDVAGYVMDTCTEMVDNLIKKMKQEKDSFERSLNKFEQK